MDNDEPNAAILAVLRERSLLAGGLADAHFFIERFEYDVSEIQWRLPHLDVYLNSMNEPDASEPVYLESYRTTLEQIEQMLITSTDAKAARLHLFRQHYGNDGRRDAFNFAIEAEADLNAIRAEIEDAEDTIASGLAANRGSIQPGTGPRLWLDGYITGLKEAVEIILSFKQE